MLERRTEKWVQRPLDWAHIDWTEPKRKWRWGGAAIAADDAEAAIAMLMSLQMLIGDNELVFPIHRIPTHQLHRINARPFELANPVPSLRSADGNPTGPLVVSGEASFGAIKLHLRRQGVSGPRASAARISIPRSEPTGPLTLDEISSSIFDAIPLLKRRQNQSRRNGQDFLDVLKPTLFATLSGQSIDVTFTLPEEGMALDWFGTATGENRSRHRISVSPQILDEYDSTGAWNRENVVRHNGSSSTIKLGSPRTFQTRKLIPPVPTELLRLIASQPAQCVYIDELCAGIAPKKRTSYLRPAHVISALSLPPDARTRSAGPYES